MSASSTIFQRMRSAGPLRTARGVPASQQQPGIRRKVARYQTIKAVLEPAPSLTVPVKVAETLDLGWKTDIHAAIAVGRPIGAGSFGQIRTGIRRESGERVAIKSMFKVRGTYTRAQTISKIHRELQMLKLVQGHAGAVRLIDYFEDSCSAKIVTELCVGGDLKAYIEENGPLDEKALALVAYEVLSFLQACNSLGIVYGDTKPSNFCLEDVKPFEDGAHHDAVIPSSFIKVVDMGSSRLVSESGRSAKRCGSPVYIAPEVFAADLSFKADVWSLGITLIELFSRRLPYWPDGIVPKSLNLDDMEHLATHLTVKKYAPLISSLSPWGKDFITKCLQGCQEQRMSVQEALQHPWIAALTNKGAYSVSQPAPVPFPVPVQLPIGMTSPMATEDGDFPIAAPAQLPHAMTSPMATEDEDDGAAFGSMLQYMSGGD